MSATRQRGAPSTALEASTARAVQRGRITEPERQDILARFRTFSDLQAAADADLVIEVVPEYVRDQAAGLPALWTPSSRPDTILATGTNALSVTRLAADTARPERVLGLHFFNPAPAMKLVEVVSSVLTAPPAVEGGHRARTPARQGTGRGRRPSGLRRRRSALRLSQPGRRDVRGQIRLPGGHRRSHAARLRSADGPARPAGPDRHRYRSYRPGGDVRARPATGCTHRRPFSSSSATPG